MIDITVSLDMAKKLKEAGWPHLDTVHYWCHLDGVYVAIALQHPRENEIAAPTAEEILWRLPEEIPYDAVGTLKGSDFWLEIAKSRFWGNTPWEIRYRENAGMTFWDCPEPIRADTLANAVAAMYCYLADQKLLPTSL